MSEVYGKVPAPRAVGFESDKNGVGRIIVTIPMVFEEGAGPLQIPKPTVYPAIPGFSVASARGREGEGGQWQWELVYEGPSPLEPGKDEEQAVYAFEPADVDVPLTSHPDVLWFIDNFGGGVEDGRLVFGPKKPEEQDGGAALPSELVSRGKGNPFFGVESYTSFAGTYSKTYTTRNPPQDLFEKVEEIVSRVPMPKWFKLPGIGKRNWLKRMPSISFRGQAVTISERYLLSGRGGFNPYIYSGRQNG